MRVLPLYHFRRAARRHISACSPSDHQASRLSTGAGGKTGVLIISSHCQQLDSIHRHTSVATHAFSHRLATFWCQCYKRTFIYKNSKYETSMNGDWDTSSGTRSVIRPAGRTRSTLAVSAAPCWTPRLHSFTPLSLHLSLRLRCFTAQKKLKGITKVCASSCCRLVNY